MADLRRVIELLESIDLKLSALVAGDRAASAKLKMMTDPPKPEQKISHVPGSEDANSETLPVPVEPEQKPKGQVGNQY